MIDAIESLRGKGKTLIPYRILKLSKLRKWLADNEILDPEGPEEMLKPVSRREGLLRRLARRARRR